MSNEIDTFFSLNLTGLLNPLHVLPVFRQQVSDGKAQQFEWIARRPHDGSTFIAQVNLEKIVFGDQEVVCATVQDITARKKAEENLAAEQERLAVTLRSIGDGVIATDMEGRIVLLNNILGAIPGNIELASYRIAKNDTKTATLLADAEKASRRAAKLTQQLLTFSKGGDPVRSRQATD